MKIEIKRGATLSWPLTRVDSAGQPVNITGVTLTSSVKLRTFSDTLAVTIDNAAAGEFTLSATSTKTVLWPVGTLDMDVKYASGKVNYSETHQIVVVGSVTP